MNNDGIVAKKFVFKKEFTRYFLVVALALFVLLFFILNNRFLTYNNIMNILSYTAVTATLSIAAMFVLMVGELDFGIGAKATLAASLLGYGWATGWFPSYWICLIVVLALMMITAFIDSRLAVYLRIPAFIATLATSKLWDAGTYQLTGGKTFYSTKWGDAFTQLGQGSTGPVPNLVLGLIVMVAIAWIILEKTRLGQHIQAAGGNAVAALQVGIPVRRVKCIAFFLCALYAAVAGIFMSSKTGNITPLMGSSIMMNAICSAMLGATFWRLGRFNIPGTLVAACMMSVISNGLTTIGAADWMQYIIQGVLLTIAVAYIAITREEGLPGVKLT